MSNQACEAFDKIADDIAQVTDLVGKITLASDEQARGVTYINRAIQEISDAAMTNAVRAEELTVVANELSTSTDGVAIKSRALTWAIQDQVAGLSHLLRHQLLHRHPRHLKWIHPFQMAQ